jgi:hypothetical protein
MAVNNPENLANLAAQIKQWGQDLGFQQVGITDTDLAQAETHLGNWLANQPCYSQERGGLFRYGWIICLNLSAK